MYDLTPVSPWPRFKIKTSLRWKRKGGLLSLYCSWVFFPLYFYYNGKMVQISELVLTECVQNEGIHIWSWVIHVVTVERIQYKITLFEFYFHLCSWIYTSINENRIKLCRRPCPLLQWNHMNPIRAALPDVMCDPTCSALLCPKTVPAELPLMGVLV